MAAAGALSGAWGVMGWTGAFAVPALALAAGGSAGLPMAAAGFVVASVPPLEEPEPEVPDDGPDVVPPLPGEPEPPPPAEVVVPPPPEPTLPGAAGPDAASGCATAGFAGVAT